MLKIESNLSQTTERAASLLDELRLRLNVVPSPSEAGAGPAADELENELQAYFSTSSKEPPAKGLDKIRDRVIDGVVDRIMQAWDQFKRPGSPGIEQAVIERLIDRVLERLGEGSTRAVQRPERAPTRR